MDSISNERTDEDGKLVSGKGVKSVEGLLVYQKERKKKKKREKKRSKLSFSRRKMRADDNVPNG